MKITIKTNGKNEAKSLILEGAFAYFTRIQTPQNVWKDKDKPLSANPEREFKTTLLVDKDVAKEWGKAFKKSKPESMDGEEAKARLKIPAEEDLPFEAEEYFVITLKQSEKYTIKDESGKAKVVVRTGKDRPQVAYKGKVITFTDLVGNGSKVTVTGTASTNPQYGTFAYLDKMLVIDLVAVGDNGANKEVFGDISFDDVDEPESNELESETTNISADTETDELNDEPPFETETDLEEDDF